MGSEMCIRDRFSTSKNAISDESSLICVMPLHSDEEERKKKENEGEEEKEDGGLCMYCRGGESVVVSLTLSLSREL